MTKAQWLRQLIQQETDECLLFEGFRTPEGYGQLRYKTKVEYAHRVAWIIKNGTYPPGNLEIMHTCDNPPCVNPKHLVLGDHSRNMDSTRKLSDDDERDIRSSRLPYQELADLYDVGKSQIFRIKHGERSGRG